MTTHTVLPDHVRLDPMSPFSSALRWVRETPAPRWEGGLGARVRFLGYVAASMVVATVVGLLGTAGFGELIERLASLAG